MIDATQSTGPVASVAMPSVDNVSHRWVPAGEVTLHLATAGLEDGPPIVLLGRYASGRITVPTSVLLGLDDPVITREMVETLRPHVGGLIVDEVPGCGHTVSEERPEQVLAHLRIHHPIG